MANGLLFSKRLSGIYTFQGDLHHNLERGLKKIVVPDWD